MFRRMARLPRFPKPSIRLVILLVGLAALCSISYWINGSIFPLDNENANIFQGGLLLVILGSLFLEDKFTRPAGAIVNALTGAISLITVYPTQEGPWWFLVFGYCALVFLFGILCIALGLPGEAHGKRASISRLMYNLSRTLGKARLLFSIVFLYAVFSLYGVQAWQSVALVIFWGMYVALWPLKVPHLLQAVLLSTPDRTARCGSILRMETPNIIRVELLPGARWDSSASIVACTGDGQQRIVLPLFTLDQDVAMLGTGLCLDACQSPVNRPQRGQVYALSSKMQSVDNVMCTRFQLQTPSLPIGLVCEGSRIGSINFDTWDAQKCREGLLVFCPINEERVYYQITDGNTREEVLEKHRHGLQVAQAAQLGTHSPKKGFKKYGWVPQPNTPVFVMSDQPDLPPPELEPDEFVIGTVPGSSVSVVADIGDMLTYHTAILGVTGTGKTELAYDLIREAVSAGIKVFCVDLTGLYQRRLWVLRPVDLSIPQDDASELDEKLFAVEAGEYAGYKEKPVLRDFASELRQEVGEQVERFLSSEDQFVGLFNLPTISNTKATILVTQMYVSAVLRYARSHPAANPILVVLEEAHTVIPEAITMGLGDFESKAMVANIAQIALQGRKYKVGLLVIAQRTATVTKTVLTQCNTIISFASFDERSRAFLANFYGKDHASLLPNLRFLEAVMFGKGINSERPLIVKIPYDESKEEAERSRSGTEIGREMLDEEEIPF